MHRNTLRPRVLASVLSLLAVVVFSRCGKDGVAPPPDDGGDPIDNSIIRGVSLSPKGFPDTYDATLDFLGEVALMRNASVMWNGAWRDDALGGSDAGDAPEGAVLIAQQSASFDLTPVPVFGWRGGEQLYLNMPDDARNDWTNASARAAFRTMLVAFATEFHPPYMFLGNENDFYYQQDAADYGNWISAYNEVYDAIKKASPTTLVGPVFSYEHMSGTGVLAAQNTPYWEALTSHDMSRVDVVGISLYPFLAEKLAASVSSDYLQPLFDRIGGKPVVITETGWPAEDLGELNPLWTPGPGEQVDYVHSLTAMIEGHDVPLVNWLFLYAMASEGPDRQAWQIFGSVSLRDRNGLERPVYALWRAFGQ